MATLKRVHRSAPHTRRRATDDGAIPGSHTALDQSVARSRRMLRRRALLAGAASMIPLPGLDLLVDLSVIGKMFAEINAEFGLTPEQIARLTPHRQKRVYRVIVAVGGAVIGRVVTREAVLAILRRTGARLTARQASRFVPVLGQVASAALSYAALRYVGEQHIRNCRRVAEMLLAQPAPRVH